MTLEILHSCCSYAVSSIKLTDSQKKAETALAHLYSCFLLEEWQPPAWSRSCSSAGLFFHFPWSPVRFLRRTMSLWWMRCPLAIAHFDALRDVSASHLAPYLVIYFMTSLPILIFSHSKFSLLPTSPARFAQSVALRLVFGSQGMNRLWLNASFFRWRRRWHLLIVLKLFSAFYRFFPLSKRSTCSHLALPIGHLQL